MSFLKNLLNKTLSFFTKKDYILKDSIFIFFEDDSIKIGFDISDVEKFTICLLYFLKGSLNAHLLLSIISHLSEEGRYDELSKIMNKIENLVSQSPLVSPDSCMLNEKGDITNE